MWLIETKGWEQPDVAYKDARAIEWCKDASTLTDQKSLRIENLLVEMACLNWKRNELAPAFLLLFLQVVIDRVQVKIKFSGVLLTDPVYFFDYRIFPHDYSPISTLLAS